MAFVTAVLFGMSEVIAILFLALKLYISHIGLCISSPFFKTPPLTMHERLPCLPHLIGTLDFKS